MAWTANCPPCERCRLVAIEAFTAELARRMGLALADAFYLRVMKAVDLLAPLVLSLLKSAGSEMEGLAEDVL
jgi:hypothetical protein